MRPFVQASRGCSPLDAGHGAPGPTSTPSPRTEPRERTSHERRKPALLSELSLASLRVFSAPGRFALPATQFLPCTFHRRYEERLERVDFRPRLSSERRQRGRGHDPDAGARPVIADAPGKGEFTAVHLDQLHLAALVQIALAQRDTP